MTINDPTRRIVNEVEESLEDHMPLADVLAMVNEWIAQNGEEATVIWYVDRVEIRTTRPETDAEQEARLGAFRRECEKYEFALAGWNRLTVDERRALGCSLPPKMPHGYESPGNSPALTPESGRNAEDSRG